MKTIEDFEAEKPQSIVSAAPSGISQGKRKGKKPNRAEIDAAIAHAANQASSEISALESGLSAPIQQWTEQKVDQLTALIADAPANVLEGLANRLGEVQGDPEHFRGIGSAIAASLFAVGSSNPTT